MTYFPSSPLDQLRKLLPNTKVQFIDGHDTRLAAQAARDSDVAIVFATQWTAETRDASLTLPDKQDVLIAAVAEANPRTAVVLETGGPVLMPWIESVDAVLAAWYPGTAGGEAIARLLTGKVSPSGRLPISFPRNEQSLVRPVLDVPSRDGTRELPFDVVYREGAAVGYRWYEARGISPLFPFGHGLTYTRFTYSGLRLARHSGTIVAQFSVRNTGRRAGIAVPQLYVGPITGGWEAPRRLGGWQHVELKPGEQRAIQVRIDPRLLALFRPSSRTWEISAGGYQVDLADSAGTPPVERRTIKMPATTLPVSYVFSQ